MRIYLLCSTAAHYQNFVKEYLQEVPSNYYVSVIGMPDFHKLRGVSPGNLFVIVNDDAPPPLVDFCLAKGLKEIEFV